MSITISSIVKISPKMIRVATYYRAKNLRWTLLILLIILAQQSLSAKNLPDGYAYVFPPPNSQFVSRQSNSDKIA